jgi:hypothetical protein
LLVEDCQEISSSLAFALPSNRIPVRSSLTIQVQEQ